MQANVVSHQRVAASALPVSVVAGLFVDEWDCDTAGVVLPRPELHVVARFGPTARGGLDVHAFGARQRVHRKTLRGGQRAVSVRLQLGAPEAVLGASASAIAGQIVPLEDLWGEDATRRLRDRLGEAPDMGKAAAIMEHAITERLQLATGRSANVRLALDAAKRLARANVNAVANELGVSERHLRRVFREAVGVSPKEFAKLTRFERAVYQARMDARASWASIAAATGYYDQAHLIAEFRAIAGVTPRALLRELRAAASVG